VSTKPEDVLEDLGPALTDLPIFPLPGVVLFPRALLPLHVFEPRYRAMVAHCLATYRAMAIALVPDMNDLDEAGQPRIAEIAGVGVILEHQALADGRANILLHGRARVTLEEQPSDSPFRRARATVREDIVRTVPSADRAALVAAATAFAGELHKKDDFTFALPPNASIGTVADLCAQHLVEGAKARQAILEQRDVADRVRMVIAELALQHRALLGNAGSVLH
jgi:Lon protease-like protein